MKDEFLRERIKMWLMYFAFIGILLGVVVLSSCDSHEPVDTHVYVGHVLCDDHSVMSLEDYLAQDRVRCVGVVFAEPDDAHGTLAVMLQEAEPLQYADTLRSVSASTDVTAFDGYNNTVLMSTGSNGHSPLAQYALEHHTFSQSDYIPSCGELRLLSLSASRVNQVMAVLKGRHPDMRIDLLNLSSEGGRCWYWSSTEDAVNQKEMAVVVSMSTGGYMPAYKTNHYSSRMVVTVNY